APSPPRATTWSPPRRPPRRWCCPSSSRRRARSWVPRRETPSPLRPAPPASIYSRLDAQAHRRVDAQEALMTTRRFPKRPSLESMVERVDQQRPGDVPGDTVPTGFPSIDRILGGGLRRRDLVVLGGDVGSGKSALALVLQRLKALALERRVALVVVSQLPRFDAKRPNARPALDDFGHLGASKQHADVVLGIYREEMYNPGHGVDGATELIVLKNRNGPTGFVDLYFYRRWMRFEDMLDPDR